MTQAAAVILAAGASSRMGRPKPLLPFRGRPLLRHVAAVALEAGCEPVVAVLGAAADETIATLDDMAVTAVVNHDWQRGPGGSIAVGLAALPLTCDAAVVLACDQPFVTAAHVRDLVAAHATTGRPMVASAYAEAVGVPALFARDCFPALLALDPTAGAKKLLTAAPARVAVVPFPAGAIDLDTPADYARYADSEEPHGLGQ